MDRAADLRRDYDLLGERLAEAKGSDAAALARERRILGELLESLEKPKEASVVDQLAARRKPGAKTAGAPKGRRKSG
jgi:hypothetical protein